MSISAILGASAWYWASASDRDASQPGLRGRPERLRALDSHPDVVAWKAASGVELVESAFPPNPAGSRSARTEGARYASFDGAALAKLADGGDPRAALIHAMNPRRDPDDAIRYLEAAAVGGGYTAALFHIALQYERKAIARGAHPLMLRLRQRADTALSAFDEQYLSWLRAAAMLDDALADNLLRRGLSSLPASSSAAIEQQARRNLEELNRRRAERHLAPLYGAPVTATVREYVELRSSPRAR